MQSVDQESTGTATAETATPPAETVSTVATTPVEKAPAKKKASSKAKKVAAKKKEKALGDSEFLKTLLDVLYKLRSRNKTAWVNLRNGTKEGEELHKLLIKQPKFQWRTIGEASYLFPLHLDLEEPPAIACVIKFDPKAEYKAKLDEFHAAMKNPRIKKKPAEPKKPASLAKDYLWTILGRRGNEEASGHAPSYEKAVEAVMRRQHQFPV